MVNRANGTRANDHRANGNRADVIAPLLSKTGLFTLLHCYVSCSMRYKNSQLEFKSRLPIPEFSGYHCIYLKFWTTALNKSGTV